MRILYEDFDQKIPVNFKLRLTTQKAVSSDQCIDLAARNTSQRRTMETEHARPRLDSRWSISKRYIK
jgi:hypothetical protein